MQIIIGREEGVRRIHCVADGRQFNLGQAGSVPLSVSRQHCKLTVNGSDILIENIKPQNITFVDGTQIFSKNITPQSTVQLGQERFTLPLQQILQIATGGPTPPPGTKKPEPPTFSLKPLESVWEEYNARTLQIQEDAAKFANKQRLQGIFSMLGMCIGAAIPVVRWALMGVCLLLALYFFYKSNTKPTLQKQLQDLDLEFTEKYKCPNPECGKPFGHNPYHMIKYNKQCFACGCKYTH